MRHYSMTRFDWTGSRDRITRVGGLLAMSTGHALEQAIRTWGPAHYTALELPLVPYGHDDRAAISADPTGAWYAWSLTQKKIPLTDPDFYSPNVFP